MKKKIALFFLFSLFSCQLENNANSEYQVEYLSHSVIDSGAGSGSMLFTIDIRNKSPITVNNYKFIFELTLISGDKVVQDFDFNGQQVAPNNAARFPFTISEYFSMEENKNYSVSRNEITNVKLVSVALYDNDNNELGKTFFPSITMI